jgi:TRAP-type C4-dicarboxylate transport system substrate-binding protein
MLTLAALAAGATLSAHAQVVVRWGDVVPATHPSVQMIERIAADVKTKTNGRVVIQVIHTHSPPLKSDLACPPNVCLKS